MPNRSKEEIHFIGAFLYCMGMMQNFKDTLLDCLEAGSRFNLWDCRINGVKLKFLLIDYDGWFHEKDRVDYDEKKTLNALDTNGAHALRFRTKGTAALNLEPNSKISVVEVPPDRKATMKNGYMKIVYEQAAPLLRQCFDVQQVETFKLRCSQKIPKAIQALI